MQPHEDVVGIKESALLQENLQSAPTRPEETDVDEQIYSANHSHLTKDDTVDPTI